MATITGTAGNDVLQATAGSNDSLVGLAGNDVLIGNTGNDTLDGGAGDDTMIGGAGNDVYIVDSAGDVVNETTTGGTDAGGTDEVQTSVAFVLPQFVENLTATGTADFALTGNDLANVIRGNSGANAIFGGVDTVADTLVGGAGNDTYTIRDGANDLVVEAPNDTLAGTTGGTDTVVVVASLNRTAYDLSTSGTAFSTAGVLSGVGASAVEVILASDAASTLALDLRGSTVAQTIVGNAGINVLDDGGNGGADTLIGLGGDDTYVVNNVGTVVTEADGGGTDVVIIGNNVLPASGTNTYVYTGSVETITANGGTGFGGAVIAAATGALNITGGTTSQLIVGNASGNSLNGGGGTDTLRGLGGSDTYFVDSLDDVVDETIAGSGGTDRIIASSSYAIGGGAAGAPSSVEILAAAGITFSTAVGGDGTLNLNALNTTATTNYFVGDTGQSQTIYGDAGANILNGRTGTGAGTLANPGVSDTLIGGNGSDTYRVYDQSDVVVEDTNGGTADYIYTSADYNLATNDANARAATLAGTGNAGSVYLGANTAANAMQIEVLSVADQVSTTNLNLTGNAYGQIIVGNYGNNTITDGGSSAGGQDQLAGLRGNDTYNVTSQTTTVNENVGEGTDVVNVNLDTATTSFFTLIDAAEVEYLNATGNNAINLRGNQFNQVITGNGAANTLDGNGGLDTLVGGLGNDVYIVTSANAANVSIVEYAGEGTDVVSTSVSFDLNATNATYTNSAGTVVNTGGIVSVDQIIVTNGQSTDNINLTGNGAAQILVGNYGNNILNGDNDTVDGNGVMIGTAAGDTLVGLLGNDTYRVYSQNDVVRENSGEGTDTVFSSANYQLRQGASVEVLSAANATSTTGLVLIGNEFAQTISGTAGNDTIWGGTGNDTLLGGGGNDIFGFNEAGAGSADILQDFSPGDLIALATTANGGNAAFFAGLGTVGGGQTAGFDQNEFVLGTTATEAHAQVLYNQATGQLFYDADGTGTGAAVLFATLQPGTGLGFNDFAVIQAPPATPIAA